MATAKINDSKVTVVSQTKRVNNGDDSTRKFNISMDVQLSEGKITGFTNGSVSPLESVEGENANFSMHDKNFSFNSYGFDLAQNKEAAAAAFEFMADASYELTANE